MGATLRYNNMEHMENFCTNCCQHFTEPLNRGDKTVCPVKGCHADYPTNEPTLIRKTPFRSKCEFKRGLSNVQVACTSRVPNQYHENREDEVFFAVFTWRNNVYYLRERSTTHSDGGYTATVEIINELGVRFHSDFFSDGYGSWQREGEDAVREYTSVTKYILQVLQAYEHSLRQHEYSLVPITEEAYLTMYALTAYPLYVWKGKKDSPPAPGYFVSGGGYFFHFFQNPAPDAPVGVKFSIIS